MCSKIKMWLKTAAGKISIILLTLSIALIIIACSSWGNLSDNSANNINNILIGLATNLLGIIITVSFVQYFIDKQDEEEERREEIALIKRYDRFMNILIQRYIIYFKCVSIPMERRSSNSSINKDFVFKDMCDMYRPSGYMYDGLLEPSVALFYSAEEKLRNYMIKMIEMIPFKYNHLLKECITTFIQQSLLMDVRGTVLGNRTIRAGSTSMDREAERAIKDSDEDIVEKFHNNEVQSHVLTPYLVLYDLMKIEIQLITAYQDYIENL